MFVLVSINVIFCVSICVKIFFGDFVSDPVLF